MSDFKPRIKRRNGRWAAPYINRFDWLRLSVDEKRRLDKARFFVRALNRKERKTR